jgi:hypothetical protein
VALGGHPGAGPGEEKMALLGSNSVHFLCLKVIFLRHHVFHRVLYLADTFGSWPPEQSGTRHHIFKNSRYTQRHYILYFGRNSASSTIPRSGCMHVDSLHGRGCVLSLRLAQLSGQRFSWPTTSCCSSPPQYEVRSPIINAPYVLERACM